MTSSTLRRLALLALALGTAFAWTPAVHAAGVVNFSTCQTLSGPNTTYRLTANLTSCGDCLVVAADKITIDLQNYTLTGTCDGSAITDHDIGYDVITIKNGTITGYSDGIALSSARTTIIGVESSHNANAGFFLRGNNAVLKSCVANSNQVGIVIVADRGQVQQCDASGNRSAGIDMGLGTRCLVTMNSANNNLDGIETGTDCTTSYNTAIGNVRYGIQLSFGGPNSLITQNTAMANTNNDFHIRCPADVTFNTSSAGFPASYTLRGPAVCHTANNE